MNEWEKQQYREIVLTFCTVAGLTMVVMMVSAAIAGYFG